MQLQRAEASWEGPLEDGHGTMKLGNGRLEAPFSFSSRFEDGSGVNPEQLIDAAAAGCFSMALAKTLSESDHAPRQIRTRTEVELEKLATGFTIPRIRLATESSVEDISDDEFKSLAANAKISCPVFRALGGVLIDLKASLVRRESKQRRKRRPVGHMIGRAQRLLQIGAIRCRPSHRRGTPGPEPPFDFHAP